MLGAVGLTLDVSVFVWMVDPQTLIRDSVLFVHVFMMCVHVVNMHWDRMVTGQFPLVTYKFLFSSVQLSVTTLYIYIPISSVARLILVYWYSKF